MFIKLNIVYLALIPVFGWKILISPMVSDKADLKLTAYAAIKAKVCCKVNTGFLLCSFHQV